MPIWTVQTAEGEDETIEAGLVATEGGALVALADDGLLTRAWAPGHWRSVHRVADAGALADAPEETVLYGLPSS